MIFARLSEIGSESIAGAVELLFGAQITGKQSREDIRNFIAGRCFDDGRFMQEGCSPFSDTVSSGLYSANPIIMVDYD